MERSENEILEASHSILVIFALYVRELALSDRQPHLQIKKKS